MYCCLCSCWCIPFYFDFSLLMSLIYLTVLLVLLQLTEFIEFILLFFIIVTTGQEKFWLRHNRFCKLVSCRLRIGDKATGDNITELFLNG